MGISPPPKYIVKIMNGTKNLFNLSCGFDKGYASIDEKSTEKNVPKTA